MKTPTIDFIIIFIIFLITFALVLPICIKNKKNMGTIKNYDSLMRKFVYKVTLSKSDILTILKTPNTRDEFSCSFHSNMSIIRFSMYGSHMDYYFNIYECCEFSIIRLEQVPLFSTSGSMIYKINPFMFRKLQAEAVPFSEYGF